MFSRLIRGSIWIKLGQLMIAFTTWSKGTCMRRTTIFNIFRNAVLAFLSWFTSIYIVPTICFRCQNGFKLILWHCPEPSRMETCWLLIFLCQSPRLLTHSYFLCHFHRKITYCPTCNSSMCLPGRFGPRPLQMSYSSQSSILCKCWIRIR